MPDITMCKGTIETDTHSFRCKDKDRCYRCQATPDQHWQSWFVNLPRNDNNTPCTYFVPMFEKDGHI